MLAPPQHTHATRRDDRALLLRTAHSAEACPRAPAEIVIFGGYGGADGEFLNSLVALDTAAGVVTEIVPAGVPPSPRRCAPA